MARSAPQFLYSGTGATVPPSMRSPTFTVPVGERRMYFAHVSRTVTKNRRFAASNDGDMKLVPPYQSGHVAVPSGVGSCPGISTGRPSLPISFDHVVLTNGR